MKSLVIRGNERSWVIEMISQINSICERNDLIIKRAGGENTVSPSKKHRMFPDVLLYADVNRTIILQGWEAKMPDVAIDDTEFINDAKRKAITLNLSSFILWNFTYAVLYERTSVGDYSIRKTWCDNSHIQSREDVGTYEEDWRKLLEAVIYEINTTCFNERNAIGLSLERTVADSIIPQIVNSNKVHVAEVLERACSRDSRMSAYVHKWWAQTQQEYLSKEKTPYVAYARTVLLNWTLRVLFAHILKRRQRVAKKVEELNDDIQSADSIFGEITKRCDFHHVFVGLEYGNILPSSAWSSIVDFSKFLTEVSFEDIEHDVLQAVLEECVLASRRELCGLYTTPVTLARILLKLTVEDWKCKILDCCCGSGTIPKLAIESKISKKFDRKGAMESVWASDKFLFPLQVANIGMTHIEAVNMACRLFQHDALTMETGTRVSIVNPENGKIETHTVPPFDCVVSNLPFVAFEVDKDKSHYSHELGGRTDLYCHIALHIASLLKEGGRAGIITSNAWLGSSSGIKFILSLRKRFFVEQVHVSGNGKWFDNADVVTTLLVLKKRSCDGKCIDNEEITFFLWKKSLGDISNNVEFENEIIQSAWLKEQGNKTIVETRKFRMCEVDYIRNLGISYNALFHGVKWFLQVEKKTKFICEVFSVRRGCRRGWDALFYPSGKNHGIESEYLVKSMKNAKAVKRYCAKAEHVAFSCSESKKQLKEGNKKGALAWIERFENQNNKKGVPLRVVLSQSGKKWYELGEGEKTEIFTMMNPETRFFFGYFSQPSFIDQRLIGLKPLNQTFDKTLLVALLNSILTLFSIEASGFPRGLGVLDINKEGVAKCRIWNPELLSDVQIRDVTRKFNVLQTRDILPLRQELQQEDRIDFEKTVLAAFGCEHLFDSIIASLISMSDARVSVKKRKRKDK